MRFYDGIDYLDVGDIVIDGEIQFWSESRDGESVNICLPIADVKLLIKHLQKIIGV